MRTLIACILIIITAFVIPQPETSGVIYGIAPVVPLVLSLLGTAYSIYSQESSQNKAEEEQKKYQKELEKRRGDYEAWFNSEYNRDFFDTDLGKSSLNQLQNTLKNTLQNQQTGAIRSGATTEAQVASQGAAQDVLADAISKLTGYGGQYKQSLRNSYDYRIQNYLQPLDQLQMGKINNYGAYGSQVGDSMSGLTSALAGVDWDSILGGAGAGYGGTTGP